MSKKQLESQLPKSKEPSDNSELIKESDLAKIIEEAK
jgi:hypothetical protein